MPSVRLWMSNLALFPIEMFSAEMIYRDFFFLFWRRWNRTLNRTDQVHSQHICFLWWLPIHKCPMIYLFLELKACQRPQPWPTWQFVDPWWNWYLGILAHVSKGAKIFFQYCVNTWLFFGSCCSNNESLFRDLNPIFLDAISAWYSPSMICSAWRLCAWEMILIGS